MQRVGLTGAGRLDGAPPHWLPGDQWVMQHWIPYESYRRPEAAGSRASVAFTSDAWNLSREKCNSARGVFVRDLAGGRTRLVSEGDGANRYIGPTRGSSGGADAFVHFLCAPTGRDPGAT